MTDWIARKTDRPGGLGRARIALFLLWLALVSTAVWTHVFWRDEVRALSIALQGTNAWQMLVALHGEGHPAVWFLGLRFGHALIGNPILPILSVAVAAAAMLLLLFRSPFAWAPLILILFSRFSIFEYAVMARNYGLSMLILFGIAAFYARWRARGVGIGIALFLLANTNLPALLLVIGVLGYWFLELAFARTPLAALAWRRWLLNAVIAGIGVILCVITVLPTYNDAAAATHGGSILLLVAHGILLPSQGLNELVLLPLQDLTRLTGHMLGGGTKTHILTSLILFGSTLVLVRRPAAFVAALGGLLIFSLFFMLVSPGGYRHHAEWLIFLLSLIWIANTAPSAETRLRPALQRHLPMLERIGGAALLGLLALQAADGALLIGRALTGPPASRSRDLGGLVAATPALRTATIIAEPDYLVEPLPYYIGNPSFLLREHHAGPVIHFTRRAELALDLGELLADARSIAGRTKRPVLILLQAPLDPLHAQKTISGYDWTFTTTPSEVAAFRRATTQIKAFGPVNGDETFTAYLLKPSPFAGAR